MAKKTIDQISVSGRRVLMRVDFNVPLDGQGAITDDRRIREAMPTLRSVIDRGGRLILISHLGRPKGAGPEPAFTLAPAAERLGELMPGCVVRFVAGDCVGDEAAAAVSALRDGEILLLENLRFHAGEKKGDADFAARLAAFGDVYCNNAFGTAHRTDASMVALPQTMRDRPRVCGFLLQKELRFLADTIAAASSGSEGGGFVTVLGGAKVSDKLGAIRNLTGRVDRILVGGAMAYTFLLARGTEVGDSLVEQEMCEEARSLMDDALAAGTEIVLPHDHRCGKSVSAATPIRLIEGSIPESWIGLDIGPETATQYGAIVGRATTVIWNGPMGVFENPPFDAGTRTVAEAMVAATGAGAVTVVGGGDTAAAMEAFGLADGVSHVSTGGGASLQLLEGRSFESVEILDDAAPTPV